MTSYILAAPTITTDRIYCLPESDRQAILAQSESAMLRTEIERMRLDFIAKTGCAFGLASEEKAKSCQAHSANHTFAAKLLEDPK